MTASAATNVGSLHDLPPAEKKQAALLWAGEYISKNGRRGAGAAVSREFGMSARWGQDIAAEVPDPAAPVSSLADRRPTGTGTADRQGTGTGTADRHSTGTGTADRQRVGTVADAAARAGMPGPARVSFGTPGSAPASTTTPGSAPGSARESAPRPAQPRTPPAGAGTRSAPAASSTGSTGTADRRRTATPADTTRKGVSVWFSEAMASGQLVAWAGFVFGGAVSVAANVKHAYIPRPPDGLDEAARAVWTAPPEWAPDTSAVVGAAVWPLMLLLAVEVMTRVSWGGGWWNLARFGGVGVVGVGSAIISYGHIHDVLLLWHYGELGARIGPLVVDGLMVVCGFALLAISQAPAREAAAREAAAREAAAREAAAREAAS